MLVRLTPAFFVLLWSTGWLVAGYAAPHAEPLTFLSARMALAAILMAGFALAAGAVWPKTGREISLMAISGMLLHGLYLGAVWWVIAHGLPVGISGLIVATQPLLTALIAKFWLGDRISVLQWSGIMIGFFGLLLALSPRLFEIDFSASGAYLWLIAVNVAGMIAVSYGTVFQKQFLHSGDLRVMTSIQNVGGIMIVFPLALLLENLHIDWNLHSTLAMAWSVLGLSLGAVSLLLWLIRQGEVSRAASLFYLVPPLVAVEAWILYGESMTLIQIIGALMAVLGVYLVSRHSP